MPTTPRTTLTRRTATRLALATPALFARPGRSADFPIRIGAPYPLTGGAASAGIAVKQAIEVAVDIINTPHLDRRRFQLFRQRVHPGSWRSGARASSNAVPTTSANQARHSFVVNTLHQAHAGPALDDISVRVLQGFLALMEAINHAGLTDLAKIHEALRNQNPKPEQLMVGYNGIKYDAKRQNALAATLLVQLEGKKYVSPEMSMIRPPILPSRAGSDPTRP